MPNKMGTTTGKFQFQDCIQTRKTGRKTRLIKQRTGISSRGETTHREQSILKPDHFQISLVQIGPDQKDEGYESDTSEQDDSLLIKLLSSKAKMPTKESRMAAGHDLYAMEEVLIPARGQTLVDTGLAVGFPRRTYARIAPRSGLANKKTINVRAGVIDADYTGEVKVILMNHGTQDSLILAGERMAQIIVEKIITET